ncbi:MAG TPA: hypothetical protein VGD81_03270 [Opitutaceae bacterium]
MPSIGDNTVTFQTLRVILIGGTSHAGKSTLAQSLASQLGWACRSTDTLAKHPGRPWRTPPKTVPEHVATHYLSLSTDELVVDVRRHYRDVVWPLIAEIVTRHATDTSRDRLVLEGSAIMPELAVTIKIENVAALWLTASDELLVHRILQASELESRSSTERTMIDRFVYRTIRYNEQIIETAGRLGLAQLDVGNFSAPETLVAACLSQLAGGVPEEFTPP